MKEVTVKDFKTTISNSGLVLAKFFSQTCQPCKEMSSILEKVSMVFNSKVQFVEIDVEKCPELSLEYGVMGVPQLLLIQNGQEVDRLVGKKSEDSIKTWILDKL